MPMNTKRIFFWSGFIIILGLIIWGLIVAMNKPVGTTGKIVGTPAPVSASDHIIGSTTAPVTIIEYSDFQCPACESYYYVLGKLLNESSSTIRLVYRQFPLPQHANAMLAAEASEAASIQGKFWEMYAMLFETPSEWTELPDAHAKFESFATKIGLDVTKYKLDVDSAAVRASVEAMRSEGEKLGIDHTPTFFLNGKEIGNPQTYEEFKTIIQSAIASSTN